MRIKLSSPPAEYIFAIIALVFGVLMVFINPPWQSNDEDRHYYSAYFIANGYAVPRYYDNKLGGYLPESVVSTSQQLQGIAFFNGEKIQKSEIKRLESIPLEPSKLKFYHNFHYYNNPIPYLPHSAGILTGNIIGAGPVWSQWLGRLSGLLCFVLITFFAIKITPIHKNSFALLSLSPMALFQAASITYDMMINSLSLLLAALCLASAFSKQGKLQWKELIIIALVAILQRYSKNGYVFIPLLFFLIPISRFSSTKQALIVYSGFLVFCVMLFFLPQLTWAQIIESIGYNTEFLPKLKKDFLHNGKLNIAYFASNPGEFFSGIIDSFMLYKREWFGGALGRFGYSYLMLPEMILIIHGLVIIAVAYLDTNKDFYFSLFQRILVIIIGVMSFFIVVIGMYFESPVGSHLVFGFQGRYWLPVLPILLLMLYNPIEKKWFKNYGTWLIAAYSIIILSFTLIFLNNGLTE